MWAFSRNIKQCGRFRGSPTGLRGDEPSDIGADGRGAMQINVPDYLRAPHTSSIWPPSGHIFISKLCGDFARKSRMALSLRDVRCDPIANRALNELMHHYTVAQEKSRLVLTKKTGDMKLFLNDLDDLHQWDFMRNQQMVKEIERLRVLLTTTNQQRESWKVRALMAEAQFLEATAKTGNNGGHRRQVCFAQALSGKAVPP